MKIFGIIIAFILGMVLLGAVGRAVRVAMLPVRVADRTIQTGEGIIDKTLTAENALYNYEWFKQQAEDIKANQAKINIANQSVISFEESAGERKDWTFEDKTEASRLRSIVQGLQSQQENLIANYNARAKMANRNIFLDGKIPDFIQIGSNFLK